MTFRPFSLEDAMGLVQAITSSGPAWGVMAVLAFIGASGALFVALAIAPHPLSRMATCPGRTHVDRFFHWIGRMGAVDRTAGGHLAQGQGKAEGLGAVPLAFDARRR